ncbi:MAG: UDP-N-acetylmuramoyl-tripeptide--D-alanyl-D-alanine ligase [Clostridiales bacterium]|nr:UDP-N-acetylmuramoyl-tripeptide--D-alanyl-D-alanine ligase [Clostridiales bacterium]
MEKILLSDIAKAVGGTTSIDKDIDIDTICTDTRQITDGCVFLAIRGDRFDGHDFVGYAFEKGAVAAITEKQVENYPCIIVNDTRKAFLELSKYYRELFNLILVGVTGSVGKTTTKEMIALVLSEKYKTLKTKGNLNNEIGLPKTLLDINKEHRAAVIEMGMSGFGEIERLSNAALPTISVITNIGFSHIESLKTQEGILKAKLEILSGMREDAPLVINADDKFLSPLKETLARTVFTYGIENKTADYLAENIHEVNSSTVFTVKYQDKLAEVILPCIGKHNILNALSAFCIGINSGVTETEIINALKKYKPDELRQNIVKKGEQTIIIDCYNASPDSMKASLSVLLQIKINCGERKIAVLGDMLELGEMSRQLHENIGRLPEMSSVDMLFTYGNESEYISNKAKELGIRVKHTSDKNRLINELKAYLKPEDVVLFKGSRGMHLEEVIDELYGVN